MWRAHLAPLAAAAVVTLSGCGGRADDGRIFLLVTVDTLRADHLGEWGYPRGTTPVLDRLAAGSVVFAECASVSSWTMPAMGTIATGLRPAEHGLVYWHLPLADVPATLAEVLEDAGIATAFFGNPIPRLRGLQRGFGRWETRDGDDLTACRDAARWLQENRDRDRFLWVHLLAPHAPYDPLPQTVPPRGGHGMTDLYDGEIRTADLFLKELLRAAGPEAAVLVTADHGESLEERREFRYDHGRFLYEELLRIPLILRLPGEAAALRRDRVSLADVAPTICDWFGTAPPGGSFGKSLLAGTREPDRVSFASVVEDDPPRHRDTRWSVRAGRWKSVFNETRGTVRLFDLDADPMETADLSAANPSETERARALLDEWIHRAPMPDIPFERRFSREELDRLKSLGYLGGSP
ncbi:MAG: sulfatase-like hydrolase/transferase [Gemmatimonadota bacterium]|nr:sulfatase-like hydrolase/transferase [Gemmatimonadota bacterium]MDP6801788.1 sulfatase-like hydrolase/transferase [Gemmatimonadota bacterium]MDP7031136.1 sulfatase-like hydrolase/transferase [Gemmatimonadota bacterium]